MNQYNTLLFCQSKLKCRVKQGNVQINTPYSSNELLDKNLVTILNSGGVAVIPTDTIYGIVGRSDNPETLRRIRKLKNSGYDQAFLVLCANVEQVRNFGVSEQALSSATKHWPGKVSIIMEVHQKHPEITGELSGIWFRIPDDSKLISLLNQTGPLVAPSANPKSKSPAMNVQDAMSYFGNNVDIYIDGGVADSKPSKLIKILPDGTETI